MMEGSGSVQIMTDPDPGGPKTYGIRIHNTGLMYYDLTHIKCPGLHLSCLLKIITVAPMRGIYLQLRTFYSVQEYFTLKISVAAFLVLNFHFSLTLMATALTRKIRT
jgi:hypothetical protein